MAWTESSSGGQNWLSYLWTFVQALSTLWSKSSQLAAEQDLPPLCQSTSLYTHCTPTVHPQQLQSLCSLWRLVWIDNLQDVEHKALGKSEECLA